MCFRAGYLCLSSSDTFDTGRVQVRIKAGFGDIVVEGDSPQEVKSPLAEFVG